MEQKLNEEEKVAVPLHECVRQEAERLLESEMRQREVGKVEVMTGRLRLRCWSRRMCETRGGGGRSVGESRDSSSQAASLISTDLTFENLPPPPHPPILHPLPPGSQCSDVWKSSERSHWMRLQLPQDSETLLEPQRDQPTSQWEKPRGRLVVSDTQLLHNGSYGNTADLLCFYVCVCVAELGSLVK